jgi:chromosome partitioning protein
MDNIFSFCNQKGGVGKTTSAVNVACIMANKGYKTLIIDMDAQANATSGLGEEKPDIEFTTYQLLVESPDPGKLIRDTKIENLAIVPSNADLAGADLELFSRQNREFILKKQLEKIRYNFDFIFIDCPPSLGLVTINSLTASSYIIIPLQCEYYALEGLSQLLQAFQLVKSNLNPNLEIGGVILTMADFRTNLTQQVIEEVRNFFKEKVFNTVIPRSVKLSEAPSFGQPAVVYDPHNRGSKSYFEIAAEFVGRFSKNKTLQATSEAQSADPQDGRELKESQTVTEAS